MPKISIVIPVYNKEKYLPRLLEQISAQDFSEFECILVNDGSSDHSAEICKTFSEKDPRYLLINKENGGVSAARNDGIDAARGMYLVFIDGDDEILPNHLSELYERITETGADMVIGGCIKFWDESDKKREIITPYNGTVDIDTVFETFAENQYKSGIYGICCNKLMRLELIKGCRFKKGLKLAEDLEFYLSVYPRLKNIYFTETQTYLYRQEAENSSVATDDQSIDYFSQLKIHFKMYNMLKDAGCLNENNRSLINKRIYDYVYFSLLYAPEKQIKKMCEDIKTLHLPPQDNPKDCNRLKKSILHNFTKGSYGKIAFVLKLYKTAKKIKRLK